MLVCLHECLYCLSQCECRFVTKQWSLKTSRFDHLNQEFFERRLFWSNPCIFISWEILFRDKTILKIEIICWRVESRAFGKLNLLAKSLYFVSTEMPFHEETMINMKILFQFISLCFFVFDCFTSSHCMRLNLFI